MRWLVVGGLIVAGLIHLGPLVGVLGGERLQRMYGVRSDDPSLGLLLRHRAVLFGLLGSLLVAGAFHDPLRGVALIAGLISAGSFLLLAWLQPGHSPELNRVALVDWFAVALLLTALAGQIRLWTR